MNDGRLQFLSSEGRIEWEDPIPFRPLTFRVNAEGTTLALLGEGQLFYFDLWTRQRREIPVDERFRLLELYKNCAVLGGYMREVAVITPGGTTREKIVFDDLVRCFGVFPGTENIIAYLQNHCLVCTDIRGEIEWEAYGINVSENMMMTGGCYSYYKNQSGDLVRFDAGGDGFYLLNLDTAAAQFSLSPDGRFLLVLDGNHYLNLFDSGYNSLVHTFISHTVSRMGISHDNSRYFIVDDEGILTCYLVTADGTTTGDFYELDENRRVEDMVPAWEKSPGFEMPRFDLRRLTVNRSGSLMGLIGRNGNVHFLDETGKVRFEAGLSSPANAIGISDDESFGYICGGAQISIVDIGHKKSKLILNEHPYYRRPIVNYHHQKIFLITRDHRLIIQEFDGTIEKIMPLDSDCAGEVTDGISCEAAGIMVAHTRGMTGYSAFGEVTYKFKASGGAHGLMFGNDQLGGVLNRSATVFLINTISGNRKKTVISNADEDLTLISLDPVLALGKEKLYRMDNNLSVLAVRNTRSSDALFFADHDNVYEIISRQGMIICYENEQPLWRYQMKASLNEWALTANGLVLLFRDSLRYIPLNEKPTGHQPHFSRYLEL